MTKATALRLIKYLFCGGLGFLTNLALFYELTVRLGMMYLYASTLSFILAGIVSFYLQKHVTYEDKTATSVKKVTYFYVLNVFNVAINALLMYMFVSGLEINKFISLILTNLLIAVYSYLLYKKFIFI